MAKPKKKSNRVNPFDRVAPTPETMQKLVRSDWRLDLLNIDQQTAAERILAAYCILTQGLGAKAADFTRTERSSSHENLGEEILEQNYREWWRACAAKRIHVSRVHGVLVDPLSTMISGEVEGRPQRFIVPSEVGGPVEIGYIEACLDEYVRVSGGRRVDRKLG